MQAMSLQRSGTVGTGRRSCCTLLLHGLACYAGLNAGMLLTRSNVRIMRSSRPLKLSDRTKHGYLPIRLLDNVAVRVATMLIA